MFALKPLPYDYSALEPAIGRETVEYHHDKHQRAYVEKLNALLADKEERLDSLDELLLHASGDIYNNAGQIWNHQFYWEGLAPAGGGAPNAALGDAITRGFQSLTEFKQQFEQAGAALFGSGWVWLVVDSAGELRLFCTTNADNPRRHGLEPLLTCDVWEHAYYLDYRHARPDYLGEFWNIVKWDEVAARHAAHCARVAAAK